MSKLCDEQLAEIAGKFSIANKDAESRFHHYIEGILRDRARGILKPGSTGDKMYIEVWPNADIWYCDDPDGWIFFFEFEDDNKVQYRSYSHMYITLDDWITDVLSPPFTYPVNRANEILEVYQLIQLFEMVRE